MTMNLNYKFWPTLNFSRYQIYQQTVHEITKCHLHFQLNRNGKVQTTRFSEQLPQRSQKNSQPAKKRTLPSINRKHLEDWSGGNAQVQNNFILKSIKTNKYWYIFVLS